MESFSLTLVAAAHLVAVDVAMAAPAVCLWLQWRAGRDQLADRLDRYLLRLSIAALLLAVLLGGLAAALIARTFPQPYLDALRELPLRRYHFGVVELIFTLACYGVALRLGPSPRAAKSTAAAGRGRFALRWWSSFLGALNLAYHFPPLFVMLGVLATRPNTWGRPASFTRLLADAEILARSVHHWLAAAIIAGLATACYGIRRRAGADDRPAIVWGCRLAAAAMLLQILSGTMLIAELPTATRHALLGGDLLATGLFGAALLAMFFALPRLAAIALGHVDRRYVAGTLALVLLVMLLMTAARHRTRDLLLDAQPRTRSVSGGAPLIRHSRPRAIYSRHAHGTHHAHRCRNRRLGQNSLGAGLQLL